MLNNVHEEIFLIKNTFSKQSHSRYWTQYYLSLPRHFKDAINDCGT